MDLSWIIAGLVTYLILCEIRKIMILNQIKKNSPKRHLRRVK